MNNFIRRVSVLVALLTVVFSAFAERRAGHVVIISMDGGKPAVIHKSRMPVLDQIVTEGAHTWTAQTIFPSITLPSHVSMLTGVKPDKHKVLWNDWLPSNGLVKVPTVFSEAKKAGLSTAMFVGKEKFRHLLQPGTVDTFDYNRETSGEVVNKMTSGGRAVKEGTVLARTVGADAAAYLAEKKPDLCFVHFADPDSVGHKFGWDSPEQVQSFGDVDTALGMVIKALREAGLADQTVVLITADHGGHDKTHGSKMPADMDIPWVAWGKGVRKNFTITAPVLTCDTTATALWLLDVPLPADLDGKPVTSAFGE